MWCEFDIWPPLEGIKERAPRARGDRCVDGRVEARREARGCGGTVSLLIIVFCELFCRHVRDLKIVICILKLVTVIVVSALKALY